MKNNCIVLADKHQNVLEGLRGLLETTFGGVVMVADQPSLIEALSKIRPQFAIVDLSLLIHDDLNGVCTLNRHSGVKLIILSDYDDPDIAAEVLSAGASGIVLKRCAGTDLLDAVDSISAGQTYISPALKKAGG